MEGMAAAGKTTFIDYLKRKAPHFCFLEQPTSEWREDERVIRMMKGEDVEGFSEYDEVEFSIETRLRQQNREIVPALDSGRSVIMHRYIYSLMAYYYARGSVSIEYIEEKSDRILQPDLVIYFDIDPSECVRRVANRTKKYPSHLTDVRFVTLLREYYLSQAGAGNFQKVIARDWKTPEELARRVAAAIRHIDIADTIFEDNLLE